MSRELTAMLDKLYWVFQDKFRYKLLGWDHMVSFLASNYNGDLLYELGSEFDWMTTHSKMSKKVAETYVPFLLDKDDSDCLGEMYYERVLRPRPNSDPRDLNTPPLSFLMGALSSPTARGVQIVFDERAGTGRFLIQAHRRLPHGIFCGVESDLRAYRIAYVNLKAHKANFRLLHADSTIHDIDFGNDNGKHNWQYANQWNPPTDKLLPPDRPRSP